MKVTTKDRDETIAFGARLAKRLKKGDCLALIGELGAGKTTLVKGIAQGLGVKDPRHVNSPSFVIVKEYRGKMPLYHFDVYRLEGRASVGTIDCDEYFYGEGITVVEWADKIAEALPARRVEVSIAITGATTREIRVKGL